MNTNMFTNPIVQENMTRLSMHGYRFLEPSSGQLACKVEGQGRLPDPSEILEAVETLLAPKDLTGETILVTAGPTREPFDPVRFITNYSSGKMGYAIARAAKRRGAEVILVSGPTALNPPAGVAFVAVSSAREMRDAVMARLDRATVVIKSAAVADYRPAVKANSKIKKGAGDLEVRLERNPDIISEIGKHKGHRILIGFAMETDDLVANATKKLKEKNMDMIVANDLNVEGSGFQGDTNVVKLIRSAGRIEELPLMDKSEVADEILSRIAVIRAEKKHGRG